MASGLAKKIAEVTECSICNQEFTKPKHLLPCVHIFCEACIGRWAKGKTGKGAFTCPLCKCNVDIPRQGIKALPDSFLAKDLIDNLKSNIDSQVSCTIHPNMTITIYCKDCDVGICIDCIQFHPKHFLNSIQNQRVELEDEIEKKMKEGEEKKQTLHKKREEMVAATNECDRSSSIVNEFASIMNGVINKIKTITTKEHHMKITSIDKCLKELQDVMSQGRNNQGSEDGVVEFMSRKETLKKLDETVRVQHDTNVHVRVQVKMKDDIDVENVFNHCFMIENFLELPRPTEDSLELMEIHPESCETQKSEIAELFRTQLIEGDTWYLVASKWFKQWKKFVGYDTWDTSLVGDDSANPGPINNALLFKEGASGEALKENLVDERDYILVPTDAWNKLVQWYGIVEEHHTIARNVIEQGMFEKHLKVEIYLMDLTLCENSNHQEVTTRKFSRGATINDIEKEMRKIYNIDRTKEVRIWNKYMSNTYEHLNKPEDTVQGAGLYHGQVIVIEQKNEDGSWQRQIKTATTS